MAKASRMKFDFITIASHQLRTPLSAMKWFLEMLLSGSGGKLTRRQHDFINEIYQSNERMIRLVNDLLIVSRIAQGTLKVVCRPFTLQTLLWGVMKELKPLTDAANITVVTKFDVTARTEINGDEDKVRQVVRTILDNAIRYMIHGRGVSAILPRQQCGAHAHRRIGFGALYCEGHRGGVAGNYRREFRRRQGFAVLGDLAA